MPRDAAQQCVNNCGDRLRQVNQAMSHELGEVQNRLQRCAQGCQDEVSNLITTDVSNDPKAMAKFQQKVQTCVEGCCKKQEAGLSSVSKRLASVTK